MGLDVSVYKNVSITESEDYDFIAYVIDKSWEWKIKNLEIDACYQGTRCYESIGYPYSSHYKFRKSLLGLIGRCDLIKEDEINWDKLENEINFPFVELINFADNEGCLDWEVNSKLYTDFLQFKNKAKNYNAHDYFPQHFEKWMNIFKVGKEKNSVVVFH